MRDPWALAKMLEGRAEKGGGTSSVPPPPADGPAASLDWSDLVRQVENSGQLRVAQLMHDWVRVVSLEPGKLSYSLAEGLADDPAAELRDALGKVTGERWQVDRVPLEGAPSLRERAETRKAAEEAEIREAPLVKATLAAFPEAELVEGGEGDRNWSMRA